MGVSTCISCILDIIRQHLNVFKIHFVLVLLSVLHLLISLFQMTLSFIFLYTALYTPFYSANILLPSAAWDSVFCEHNMFVNIVKHSLLLCYILALISFCNLASQYSFLMRKLGVILYFCLKKCSVSFLCYQRVNYACL